jgi:hypothetical protein
MSSMARRATWAKKFSVRTRDVAWTDLVPDWMEARTSRARIVTQLVTRTMKIEVVRNPPPERVLESVSWERVSIAM